VEGAVCDVGPVTARVGELLWLALYVEDGRTGAQFKLSHTLSHSAVGGCCRDFGTKQILN
jgi:hypothetical protein